MIVANVGWKSYMAADKVVTIAILMYAFYSRFTLIPRAIAFGGNLNSNFPLPPKWRHLDVNIAKGVEFHFALRTLSSATFSYFQATSTFSQYSTSLGASVYLGLI